MHFHDTFYPLSPRLKVGLGFGGLIISRFYFSHHKKSGDWKGGSTVLSGTPVLSGFLV